MFRKRRGSEPLPSSPHYTVDNPPDTAYTVYDTHHPLRGWQKVVVPEGGTAPTAEKVSVIGKFVAREDALRQADVERTRSLIKDLDSTYAGFLAEAQTRGLDEPAAGEAVVAAWNEGALPRVARTVEYRGGGYPIYFLHGHVPEDLFSHMEEMFEEPLIQYGGQHGGGVVVERLETMFPTQPDPQNPEAFYVESFTLPQTTDNRQVHRGVVEEVIDRAYAQIPQSPPQPQ